MFISDKSKLPDHSAITSDFNISDCCIVSDTERTEHPKNRFHLQRIPFDDLANELKWSALIATIDLIENSRKSQECIDETYEKLCNILSNEMETLIPEVEYKNRNNCLKNKPYLTDQLTEL